MQSPVGRSNNKKIVGLFPARLVEHYRDVSMVAGHLDPDERRTMLGLYERVGEAVQALLDYHARAAADASTGDAP